MSKKSKIGLVALAVLTVLGGVYVFQAMEPQDNFKKLEKTCAALTENDPDGRVYEPIVGRFLGSESQIYSVSGPWPERIDLRMVLGSDSRNADVYYTVPVKDNLVLAEKLFSVVGKDTIVQKVDSNKIYGICAYKNERDNNIGALKTFVKLKD